jgi:hypothetical protein
MLDRRNAANVFQTVARLLSQGVPCDAVLGENPQRELGVVRMTKFALTLVAAAFVAGSTIHTAHAIPPFNKEFDSLYVKDSKNEEFVASVKKAKCLVCHGKDAEGKEQKKIRNEYGKAVGKLVTKKDKDDVEKIKAALETVAKEKSNPEDPNSPTFGELISKGKLPAEK